MYFLVTKPIKNTKIWGFQRTSCPLVESLRGKASQIEIKYEVSKGHHVLWRRVWEAEPPKKQS